MKNKDVIIEFFNKRSAKGSNLMSDGTKLINYYTTLAQWFEDALIVNTTAYSISTTRNQNIIYEKAHNPNKNIHVIEVYNVPKGTTNLKYYL